MELVALVGGELNAAFRMVLGSWDMAASLVTSGAIDGEAFRAAHGEILATFSKIHPFPRRDQVRQRRSRLLPPHGGRRAGRPDAEAMLARRRDAALALAKERRFAPLPPGT